MISKELEIPGVFVLSLKVFEDERGSFMESFNKKTFAEHVGQEIEFVQDNHSISAQHVFRGMHFQRPPHAQDKLVRVTQGKVMDYVLDIRTGSPTYGTCIEIELSAESNQLLFIPKGMAHGFLALEDDTHFTYKCSDYYHPESEDSVLFSSILPDSKMEENMILSRKDLEATDFSQFKSPF